jgi:predicted nucleic acid-binding protein
MYLIDTNVISEQRKQHLANAGVRTFFAELQQQPGQAYISAISVGEIRRGIDLCAWRGDIQQSTELERWLQKLLQNFSQHILAFDVHCAQVWGRMRVPHPEAVLDKQIAATALVYNLIVVTRNERDFANTGVRLLNPFR